MTVADIKPPELNTLLLPAPVSAVSAVHDGVMLDGVDDRHEDDLQTKTFFVFAPFLVLPSKSTWLWTKSD